MTRLMVLLTSFWISLIGAFDASDDAADFHKSNIAWSIAFVTYNG